MKDVFKFDLPEDTLAMVVISTPSMFEKSFLPFLKSNSDFGDHAACRDPIDECVKQAISSCIQVFLHIES